MLHLENTGMAVTIDIGEANDVHPKNKQEVGRRLSLIARANSYNENIPFSGPVYDSYRIEQNSIRITFKHENFFRNLHTRYPGLTSNDLRLCAYLRLNLSSKDIANLMNISLKGVEAGRYRLRKKLNISAEKNLTEFMIELK